MFKMPKIHTHAEIGAMNICDYILTKPLCEVTHNRIDARSLNKSWQLLNAERDPVINDGIATYLVLKEIVSLTRDPATQINQLAIDGAGRLIIARPNNVGQLQWNIITNAPFGAV
jgi:hypothetical protein